MLMEAGDILWLQEAKACFLVYLDPIILSKYFELSLKIFKKKNRKLEPIEKYLVLILYDIYIGIQLKEEHLLVLHAIQKRRQS